MKGSAISAVHFSSGSLAFSVCPPLTGCAEALGDESATTLAGSLGLWFFEFTSSYGTAIDKIVWHARLFPEGGKKMWQGHWVRRKRRFFRIEIWNMRHWQ